MNFKLLTEARKTGLALASAAVSWGYIVVESPAKPVTASEWLAGAVLALGVFGVNVVKNK